MRKPSFYIKERAALRCLAPNHSMVYDFPVDMPKAKRLHFYHTLAGAAHQAFGLGFYKMRMMEAGFIVTRLIVQNGRADLRQKRKEERAAQKKISEAVVIGAMAMEILEDRRGRRRIQATILRAVSKPADASGRQ